MALPEFRLWSRWWINDAPPEAHDQQQEYRKTRKGVDERTGSSCGSPR